MREKSSFSFAPLPAPARRPQPTQAARCFLTQGAACAGGASGDGDGAARAQEGEEGEEGRSSGGRGGGCERAGEAAGARAAVHDEAHGARRPSLTRPCNRRRWCVKPGCLTAFFSLSTAELAKRHVRLEARGVRVDPAGAGRGCRGVAEEILSLSRALLSREVGRFSGEEGGGRRSARCGSLFLSFSPQFPARARRSCRAGA